VIVTLLFPKDKFDWESARKWKESHNFAEADIELVDSINSVQILELDHASERFSDKPWDANAVRWKLGKDGFLWAKGDNRSDWKFPYKFLDGTISTKAVAAAKRMLLGARSGKNLVNKYPGVLERVNALLKAIAKWRASQNHSERIASPLEYAEFKGEKIFREGIFTSAEGITREWTSEDIDTIIANHVAFGIEPNVTTGDHSRTGKGKVGIATNLRRDPDDPRWIVADIYVPDEYAKYVGWEKAFSRPSVSIVPDLTIDGVSYGPAIKSVTLLGDLCPAIPDIPHIGKEISWNPPEQRPELQAYFSEDKNKDKNYSMSVSAFNVEDKRMPSNTETNKSTSATTTEAAKANHASGDESTPAVEKLEQQFAEAVRQNEQLQALLKKREEEMKKRDALLIQNARKLAEIEVDTFCEDMINKGVATCIVEAARPILLATSYPDTNTVNFSEKEKGLSFADAFKKFISVLIENKANAFVDFSEQADQKQAGSPGEEAGAAADSGGAKASAADIEVSLSGADRELLDGISAATAGDGIKITEEDIKALQSGKLEASFVSSVK